LYATRQFRFSVGDSLAEAELLKFEMECGDLYIVLCKEVDFKQFGEKLIFIIRYRKFSKKLFFFFLKKVEQKYDLNITIREEMSKTK
jgi:hypothetical protein